MFNIHYGYFPLHFNFNIVIVNKLILKLPAIMKKNSKYALNSIRSDSGPCLQTESGDRSFFLEGTLAQAQRLCMGYDHLGLLTSFATRSYIGTLPTLSVALFTLPSELSTSLCCLLYFVVLLKALPPSPSLERERHSLGSCESLEIFFFRAR